MSNNETKLFLQANHPDVIDEACNIVKDIVCCHDTLGNLLSEIPLDAYINQEVEGTVAPTQVGGTCYANACATVLHLAMMRIKGRQGGYPSFDVIRARLVQKYGSCGASSQKVLQAECPYYRLQSRPVETQEALEALICKRPVVSLFYLTDPEWKAFSDFFRRNPKGVISRKEIDVRNRPANAILNGHAVVLVGFNSQGLRFMNFWSTGWGDEGFFRVETADVLDLTFIDIFWTVHDLKDEERLYFERNGSQEAANWLSTLTGLRTSEYSCPMCRVRSLLSEFCGSMMHTMCPKCHGVFKSDKYLKLFLYLKSLSE